MKRLTFSAMLLVAALGCGSKDPSNQTAQAPAETATSPAAPTQAQSAVVTNGASTEPGEIVALFLDSLRRGDEKAANGVLTQLAQESLAKTDYAIDPGGTSEGKYTIGRVGFVDEEKTTCLVECVWTEPNPDLTKQPIEMEIVCEVHKEPQGWRISGMAVKMPGNEEAFVLDFEDPQSLQQALGGGQAQAPANVAQTPATAGAPGIGGTVTTDLGVQGTVTTNPANQFPTQPGVQPQPSAFPSAPNAGQAPTQIAFPPTPSVNR